MSDPNDDLRRAQLKVVSASAGCATMILVPLGIVLVIIAVIGVLAIFSLL